MLILPTLRGLRWAVGGGPARARARARDVEGVGVVPVVRDQQLVAAASEASVRAVRRIEAGSG